MLLLRSSITCFTSFRKTDWNKNLQVIFNFCLLVLMLGWFTNLLKINLHYYHLRMQEELWSPRSTKCRSNDSNVDLKYSFISNNIDLLCKSMDWFLYDIDLRRERVNIMSVSASLLFFFWKVRLVFHPKRFTCFAWTKTIEVCQFYLSV